jgi:hypothetical protein
MARDDLSVGAIVRMTSQSTEAHDARETHRHVEYRIEQRVELAGGTILYKVKNDAEPFDRIIDERDLALRS